MDTLAVDFTNCNATQGCTKRGILWAMAKVYDPIGLVSPVMLEAKHLYRTVCDKNIRWDALVEFTWHQWLKNLPVEIAMPRRIVSEALV